jgi:2-C-methyl-D-erythritol 2,4-cyclodiphosphate synthase
MSLRIGHGVDAHRLVDGRLLMLGGIHVPYARGLFGHSDGDVVCHALASALLGAAGMGTLGDRFPSDDMRWEDISGRDLLGAVGVALAEQRAVVVSAQVVVIAQEPRLQPHLGTMQSVLAETLGVSPGTVTVSVTTTDGMGATGRGEGIAASAVALVAMGAP